MKLRNMSATVEHVASITLRLENCEGCVNFPCVGVCGLSEYVERY